MVSSVKLFLGLTVLASLACTGYAIKCYQCDSITNSKCGEKFEKESSFLLDCSKIAPPRFLNLYNRNATGCLRKVLDTVPQHPLIIRSCYFGDLKNTQAGCQDDPSLSLAKQLGCDVCTEDECNGSASLAPMVGAILLFFGVARVLA